MPKEDSAADTLLDRLVEVNKARLSLNLFLALAMVTITGFAVRENKPRLFLVAAAIPTFTLLVDILLRARFMVPIAYKLMSVQDPDPEKEEIGFLFYGFGSSDFNGFRQIFSEDPGTSRQRMFRKKFIGIGLARKVFFYSLGTIGEVALYFML